MLIPNFSPMFIVTSVICIMTASIVKCIPLRTKRAFSYIANETACTVDHIVYRDGDPIPTDDPCETCRCRPPGFNCLLRECEVKTGCRAIRRIGECCPLYQCGCEHNGLYYQDGDRIPNAESPCYSCYCQGSSITCSLADCKFRFDCEPEYIIGECCPRYDHCPPEYENRFVTIKSTEIPLLTTAFMITANRTTENGTTTAATTSTTTTPSTTTTIAPVVSSTELPTLLTTTTTSVPNGFKESGNGLNGITSTSTTTTTTTSAPPPSLSSNVSTVVPIEQNTVSTESTQQVSTSGSSTTTFAPTTTISSSSEKNTLSSSTIAMNDTTKSEEAAVEVTTVETLIDKEQNFITTTTTTTTVVNDEKWPLNSTEAPSTDVLQMTTTVQNINIDGTTSELSLSISSSKPNLTDLTILETGKPGNDTVEIVSINSETPFTTMATDVLTTVPTESISIGKELLEVTTIKTMIFAATNAEGNDTAAASSQSNGTQIDEHFTTQSSIADQRIITTTQSPTVIDEFVAKVETVTASNNNSQVTQQQHSQTVSEINSTLSATEKSFLQNNETMPIANVDSKHLENNFTELIVTKLNQTLNSVEEGNSNISTEIVSLVSTQPVITVLPPITLNVTHQVESKEEQIIPTTTTTLNVLVDAAEVLTTTTTEPSSSSSSSSSVVDDTNKKPAEETKLVTTEVKVVNNVTTTTSASPPSVISDDDDTNDQSINIITTTTPLSMDNILNDSNSTSTTTTTTTTTTTLSSTENSSSSSNSSTSNM